VLDWLGNIYEWLYDRLEPPARPDRHRSPRDFFEVWTEYRLQRLERRIAWLFRLVAILALLEAGLWFLG